MENWIVSVILFRSLTLIYRHVSQCWVKYTAWKPRIVWETLDLGTRSDASSHQPPGQTPLRSSPPPWDQHSRCCHTTKPPRKSPKNVTKSLKRPGLKTHLTRLWLTTLTRYGPIKAQHSLVGGCRAHIQHTATPQGPEMQSEDHKPAETISGSFQFRYIRHTLILDYRIKSEHISDEVHIHPFFTV